MLDSVGPNILDNVRATSEIVVAVDIGTTKICAIAGVRNEYEKIEILGMGTVQSLGVSRGVVSNIDKTVKAIKSAVEMAEKAAKKKFKKVHVGIAGQHIKSIHHHGLLVRGDAYSEITKEDVEKLIDDMHKIVLPPGDKILHVFPQEFTVDDESEIMDPIGMSGVRLEANFHIITGQMTASRNILRCVEKVGLEVKTMTLEPIASAKSVLTEEEKEAGVALVDIGGGTTDITIFQDGIIRHTAVIPFGGNIITSDIKQGCTVMHDQAEKLKVKFGSALADEVYDNRIITIPGLKGRDPKEISERNLARIIQARLEEILDYIRWEIKRSGFEKKLIGGIVLTGGGSMLKNINLLTEFHTGFNARIGIPVDHLAHGYSSQLASPIYSTALGLLLIALEQSKENEQEVFDIDDHASAEIDGVELPEEEAGAKSKWYDKIFTYTREFFEASPDSEF